MPKLPEDVPGALHMLRAAASWLIEMYWNGDMKRNAGWRDFQGAKEAWEILHLAIAELETRKA